jgi:hypothetical protein
MESVRFQIPDPSPPRDHAGGSIGGTGANRIRNSTRESPKSQHVGTPTLKNIMKKNENVQSRSLRITLPLSGSNQSLGDMLSHGLLYATEVKRMGGKARCLRAANAVIVELSGVSREKIEPLIDCLDGSPSMKGVTMKVIVEERETPEISLEFDGVIPGEFTRTRLTKKFLLELPEGAIVVGNSIFGDNPNFVVELKAETDRYRIWRRAIESDAAQRICSVYWSNQDVMDAHGFNFDAENEDHDDEWPLPMSRM